MIFNHAKNFEDKCALLRSSANTEQEFESLYILYLIFDFFTFKIDIFTFLVLDGRRDKLKIFVAFNRRNRTDFSCTRASFDRMLPGNRSPRRPRGPAPDLCDRISIAARCCRRSPARRP